MPALSYSERTWNGRRLKVASVTPEERDKIVRATLAIRAFRLSQNRGFQPGHGLEDWQRAESEILAPLSCGFLVLDRSLELTFNAGIFAEGEIQVYVEPKRLTFCGKARNPNSGLATKQPCAEESSLPVIRTVRLPFEIDPSGVTARFKGQTIEMDLPRAAERLTVSAAN